MNERDQAQWGNMPFMTSLEILGYVRHILAGKNQDLQPKAFGEDIINDTVEIVHVYLSMYETWDTSFFGAPIAREAFRNVVITKDQKLNLTNEVWKRAQRELEPVIANCTNALATFESVYQTNKDNLTEDTMHALWAIRAKRYDFIPWLLFILTANVGVWLVASTVVAKAGCGEDFNVFKQRLMGVPR